MNFFRSEEHLRNWTGSRKRKRGGIIPLEELMRLFSSPYFTQRRNPFYFSHMPDYVAGMIKALDGLEKAGKYWRLKRYERVGVNVALKLGLM